MREGQRSLSLTPLRILDAARSWNCLLLIHLMAGVNQVAFGAANRADKSDEPEQKGWAVQQFIISLCAVLWIQNLNKCLWVNGGCEKVEHLVALFQEVENHWSLTQVSFIHLTWWYPSCEWLFVVYFKSIYSWKFIDITYWSHNNKTLLSPTNNKFPSFSYFIWNCNFNPSKQQDLLLAWGQGHRKCNKDKFVFSLLLEMGWFPADAKKCTRNEKSHNPLGGHIILMCTHWLIASEIDSCCECQQSKRPRHISTPKGTAGCCVWFLRPPQGCSWNQRRVSRATK